jgi:hypothetical protein
LKNGANIGKISVSSPYRVKKLQYFPRFVPFQYKNMHKDTIDATHALSVTHKMIAFFL